MPLSLPTFFRTRMRMIACAAVITMATLLPFAAESAPGKWEQVKTERSDTRTIAKDSDSEIKAARGVVVITSSKSVQVKIYTILGRLVSRETLPAGTSQISIQPHGVYIIKIGDLTCKAAL